MLEIEARMLEEKLKYLKQQVEYENSKKTGQKRWATATTAKPLTNYGKQILLNKNKKPVELPKQSALSRTLS